MHSNPYSSPIHDSSPNHGEALQRVPPRLSGLMVLCGVIGCYGVGFGAFMILVGLFVGQHVLFAAVAHILFGSAILASALGINANRAWACRAIMALSTILVFVSVVAIFASITDHDHGATSFWGFVFAFFMAVDACVLRRTINSSGRSNPADRQEKNGRTDKALTSRVRMEIPE